ncbi:MAG TPA: hypothetical protein VFT29_02200 [Gemmatimonadaceae bacterium]|nr:hypothetical protein [Gemmatimonadaceae bacterium]
MRRHLAYVAMIAAVALAACTDTSSPRVPLTRAPGSSNLTLDDYIQQQIDILLPKGFEDAVDARWSTVKSKKNGGDFDNAVRQLNALADWIVKKTNDITPPTGETKKQASVRLILNMANWVYLGADAPIQLVEGADVNVAVSRAGTPLSLVSPELKAGVSFAGQAEDRIIVINQDKFDGICNGPLDTPLCQYPLFYKFESFPKKKLNTPGRFAVCLVTTGDRRPLDRLSDEIEGSEGPVHQRMRLAHEKPANPDDYTPGGTIAGNIEILPPSPTQTGLVQCNEHSDVGLTGPKKALHYALHLVERVFSPRVAEAYDRGPEHDSDFFSHFNGVDPLSIPDLAIINMSSPLVTTVGKEITLSYAVENKSRRTGGDATAASSPSTVQAYLSLDQTIDANDISVGSATVPAMAPDATPFPVSHTFNAPATYGPYYLLVEVTPNTPLPEVTLVNNDAVQALNVDQDFVGIWNGFLQAPGVTEGGQPATFIVESQVNGVCSGQFRVAQPGSTVAYNTTYIFTSCGVSGQTLSSAIDPWSAPTTNAVASFFTATRSGTTLTGTAARAFPLEGGGRQTESPAWTLNLTLGTEATVGPPPSIVGLRSSNLMSANSMAQVLY